MPPPPCNKPTRTHEGALPSWPPLIEPLFQDATNRDTQIVLPRPIAVSGEKEEPHRFIGGEPHVHNGCGYPVTAHAVFDIGGHEINFPRQNISTFPLSPNLYTLRRVPDCPTRLGGPPERADMHFLTAGNSAIPSQVSSETFRAFYRCELGQREWILLQSCGLSPERCCPRPNHHAVPHFICLVYSPVCLAMIGFTSGVWFQRSGGKFIYLLRLSVYCLK